MTRRTFRPREHMTRWLDPWAMSRALARLVTSRRAERARETLAPAPVPTIDHGAIVPEGDGDDAYWLDYVADLGDGFDPTMAVAWTLGRTRLSIEPHRLGEWPPPPTGGLPRGRVLVLGGDLVYPYATDRSYRDRVVGPYSLAHEGPDAGAAVVALPGNHDWYGGLGPFRRAFLDGADRLGGWDLPQGATWFSLRLPHGWWMWGLDTGLSGSINPSQRAYFEEAASHLGPDDRVVICTPVPLWVLHNKHPEQLTEIDELVERLLGPERVPLYLAGDSHVFAAWNRRRPTHPSHVEVHVTSGGGGAFLHPTHHLPLSRGSSGRMRFHLRKAWPREAVSERLAAPWWALMVDRQSRLLIPLLGGVHVLYSWLVWGSLDGPRVAAAHAGLLGSLARPVTAPGGIVLLAGVVAGCVAALRPNHGAPTVRRAARRFGVRSGLTQVPVFVVGALLARLAWAALGDGGGGAGGVVVAGVAGVAAAIGSLAVFAQRATRGNALISLGDNLVFSARHLEAYKHLLRLRIDGEGGLTVFALGIEDPGTGWRVLLDHPGSDPPAHSAPRYIWGTRLP